MSEKESSNVLRSANRGKHCIESLTGKIRLFCRIEGVVPTFSRPEDTFVAVDPFAERDASLILKLVPGHVTNECAVMIRVFDLNHFNPRSLPLIGGLQRRKMVNLFLVVTRF